MALIKSGPNMRAVAELAERNERMEKREKARKVKEDLFFEKAVGFSSALGAAFGAGYADGKLDLTDGNAGDGVRIMGVPVMPVIGGVAVVGGLWAGGTAGTVAAYSGLGTLCGTAFEAGKKKGSEG